MSKTHAREQLEALTKDQLLKDFSKYGVKQAMSKANIITAIMEGERIELPESIPSAAGVGVDIIGDTMADGVEKFNLDGIKPNIEYVVVHPIREDGRLFGRGSKYTGRFPGLFLKGGQIKIQV